MENIIKTILETIKKITDNLDKTSKLALLTALGLFILSKIISIFKFNIPGLSITPIALVLFTIGFNIIKENKDNSSNDIKSKAYFIFGSILSGLSLLIFGCIAIVYPFIILGSIML